MLDQFSKDKNDFQLIIFAIIVFVFTSLLFVLVKRNIEIEISIYILFFAFLTFCFILCFIILSLAQYKRDNISNNVFKEVSNLLLKQMELEENRKKNDSYDYQKLYYKILLELGKLKSKNESLKNEINILQNKLNKLDTESQKANLKTIIKIKNDDLDVNSKEIEELQHNLNSIEKLLEEIKKNKADNK